MSCLLRDLSGRLKPRGSAAGAISNDSNNTMDDLAQANPPTPPMQEEAKWLPSEMTPPTSVNSSLKNSPPSTKAKQTAKSGEAITVTYKPIDAVRKEAEEILKDGITNMTDRFEGLQKMAAAEVSRQLGAGLLDIVTGLIMEMKKKDAHNFMLEKKQGVMDHDWDKLWNRCIAEEEYREHCMEYHGHWADFLDGSACDQTVFDYRDRDSDDTDEEEEEEDDYSYLEENAPILEYLPPPPHKPLGEDPTAPTPARTAYSFFEQEWIRQAMVDQSEGGFLPRMEWRVLTAQQRVPYEKSAEQDKKRHEKEVADLQEHRLAEYQPKAAEERKRYESEMAEWEKTVDAIEKRNEEAMDAFEKFLEENPPIREPTRGDILREAFMQAEDELKAFEKGI